MGTFLVTLGIVVALAFGAMLTLAIKQDNQKRAARDQGLASLKNEYKADEAYVSLFDLSIVGIRWSDQTVLLGTAPTDLVSFSFSEIISSDVEVEGGKVTRTTGQTKSRRGAQMMGAAAGGLALGPAGLVVGGLSGGSSTTSISNEVECVSRIALAVHVRDRATPIRRVVFWEWPAPGAPRDDVREIMEEASRFQALLRQRAETATAAR